MLQHQGRVRVRGNTGSQQGPLLRGAELGPGYSPEAALAAATPPQLACPVLGVTLLYVQPTSPFLCLHTSIWPHLETRIRDTEARLSNSLCQEDGMSPVQM